MQLLESLGRSIWETIVSRSIDVHVQGQKGIEIEQMFIVSVRQGKHAGLVIDGRTLLATGNERGRYQ